MVIYSCSDKPDFKLYIKSISQNNIEINWYCHSLLSSLSPGTIEAIENKKVYDIVSSHYLTDVLLSHDTLILQVYKKDSLEINHTAIANLRLKIIVDTSGKSWNDEVGRITRLGNKKVDLTKPHNDDGYSEKENYQ